MDHFTRRVFKFEIDHDDSAVGPKSHIEPLRGYIGTIYGFVLHL